MSKNQFEIDQLTLAIEDLFSKFRSLPHDSRAIIWAQLRIKLLEEFKDFIIQENDIAQDAVIEISYENADLECPTNDTDIVELPFELEKETKNYFCTSTLENGENRFFPYLKSVINEDNDKFTKTNSENLFPCQKSEKISQTKNRLICNYCGKQYDGQKVFDKHIQRHENERSFECANCSQRFIVKEDLVKHLKTHSAEKNFQCSVCFKKLVNKTILRNHMKVIHQKNEKYFCQQCDYFSYSNRTLKEHVKIKHNKLFTKYACVICKNVFKSRVMLKIHLRSHTGEKPYQCKLCEAAFICSGRLTNHMNSVHGENKFSCEVCEKSFKTSHKLKRHLLIHTRLKPFSCPFCNNFASNTQGNLTKHVKTVHQMNNFSYRRYKKMMLGEIEEVQDEWIKNAELFTNTYLKDLSKNNQLLTVEQLKEQYLLQKTKKITEKNNQRLNDTDNLPNDQNTNSAFMLS